MYNIVIIKLFLITSEVIVMQKKPVKIIIEVALIPVTILLWVFLKLSEKRKSKKQASSAENEE